MRMLAIYQRRQVFTATYKIWRYNLLVNLNRSSSKYVHAHPLTPCTPIDTMHIHSHHEHPLTSCTPIHTMHTHSHVEAHLLYILTSLEKKIPFCHFSKYPLQNFKVSPRNVSTNKIVAMAISMVILRWTGGILQDPTPRWGTIGN